MKINKTIPLLDSILLEWKPIIAHDYDGYRNHVYRMVHFCFYLKTCSQEEQEKIIIAAAFHDIGLWHAGTLDYIPPSITPAMQYLRKNDLEDWSVEVALMISEHHKLRPYQNTLYPLVEVFRKADLVDFSLGIIKCGVDKGVVLELQNAFPNCGFHRGLAEKAAKWFVAHPFNPVPMMKW